VHEENNKTIGENPRSLITSELAHSTRVALGRGIHHGYDTDISTYMQTQTSTVMQERQLRAAWQNP